VYIMYNDGVPPFLPIGRLIFSSIADQGRRACMESRLVIRGYFCMIVRVKYLFHLTLIVVGWWAM
jgi:hypothetical protein